MNKRTLLMGAGLFATIGAAAVGIGGRSFGQQASGVAQSTAGAQVSVEENVLYGTVDGTALHLDVYSPPDKSDGHRAAVILIHGGGWTDLDKSTMRTMGNFLARSGFVCFAADYRLFHGADTAWPAQLDDVQRAVRWIRANAEKYGVNAERIGAFGHSAGAQLAALLGMEDTRDNSDATLAKYSSRVQAVVDVSGPTDFTGHRDAESAEFLKKFFGGDYEKRPEVWRGASPVFHASKDDAAFLILHGTQDDNVNIAEAQELYEKLQTAGATVSFVKVNDAHLFRTPEARRELAIETLAFFNRNLVTAR
jgi:acetyl esterase/lipase